MNIKVEPSLMVTSLHFMADSPYIDSFLNLSTMATFLQWSLSSVLKVADV